MLEPPKTKFQSSQIYWFSCMNLLTDGEIKPNLSARLHASYGRWEKNVFLQFGWTAPLSQISLWWNTFSFWACTSPQKFISSQPVTRAAPGSTHITSIQDSSPLLDHYWILKLILKMNEWTKMKVNSEVACFAGWLFMNFYWGTSTKHSFYSTQEKSY